MSHEARLESLWRCFRVCS